MKSASLPTSPVTLLAMFCAYTIVPRSVYMCLSSFHVKQWWMLCSLLAFSALCILWVYLIPVSSCILFHNTDVVLVSQPGRINVTPTMTNKNRKALSSPTGTAAAWQAFVFYRRAMFCISRWWGLALGNGEHTANFCRELLFQSTCCWHLAGNYKLS